MRDYHLDMLYCSSTGEEVPGDSLQNLSAAGKPILCRYDLPGIAADVDR
jgi:threonine synthase